MSWTACLPFAPLVALAAARTSAEWQVWAGAHAAFGNSCQTFLHRWVPSCSKWKPLTEGRGYWESSCEAAEQTQLLGLGEPHFWAVDRSVQSSMVACRAAWCKAGSMALTLLPLKKASWSLCAAAGSAVIPPAMQCPTSGCLLDRPGMQSPSTGIMLRGERRGAPGRQKSVGFVWSTPIQRQFTTSLVFFWAQNCRFISSEMYQ